MSDDYARYDRLMRSMAWKATKRAHVLGLTLEFEDAHSEMWALFLHCQKQFDPTLGFQLTSYFISAAKNWIRKLSKQANGVDKHATMRLDDMISNGQDDETPLYDTIEDTTQRTPEAIVEWNETVAQLKTEAPVVARLLQLIQDAPSELMEELAAHQELLERSGEEGGDRNLTIQSLSRMFDFNWRQRLLLTRELEKASLHVTA